MFVVFAGKMQRSIEDIISRCVPFIYRPRSQFDPYTHTYTMASTHDQLSLPIGIDASTSTLPCASSLKPPSSRHIQQPSQRQQRSSHHHHRTQRKRPTPLKLSTPSDERQDPMLSPLAPITLTAISSSAGELGTEGQYYTFQFWLECHR